MEYFAFLVIQKTAFRKNVGKMFVLAGYRCPGAGRWCEFFKEGSISFFRNGSGFPSGF